MLQVWREGKSTRSVDGGDQVTDSRGGARPLRTIGNRSAVCYAPPSGMSPLEQDLRVFECIRVPLLYSESMETWRSVLLGDILSHQQVGKPA